MTQKSKMAARKYGFSQKASKPLHFDRHIHRVSEKKTVKIVFVITLSNFY